MTDLDSRCSRTPGVSMWAVRSLKTERQVNKLEVVGSLLRLDMQFSQGKPFLLLAVVGWLSDRCAQMLSETPACL